MSGYTHTPNEAEAFWPNDNDPQLQHMYYEEYARFQKQQLGNCS